MPDRVDAKEVKLSVIIPSHNLAPWIVECVRSVLRQDVDGLEVVIVEDHSTDASLELLTALAHADSRIRVVPAQDFGSANARNQGARLARGEYLIFVDGDDIVPDGAYRSLVSSLEQSGSDMALGSFLIFSSGRTWEYDWAPDVFARPKSTTTLRETPALVQGRTCWNKMFRRDFWESTGILFPEVLQANDVVPMLRALVSARSIDLVPDYVYLYRKRPGVRSITAQSRSVASLHSCLIEESMCAELIAQHGDPQALDIYFTMVLTAVTRSHLSRFLAAQAGQTARRLGSAAPLLKKLVESAPAHVWQALSLDQKRTYSLCGADLPEVLAFLQLWPGESADISAESEDTLADLRHATRAVVDGGGQALDPATDALRLQLLRSILTHAPELNDELLGELIRLVTAFGGEWVPSCEVELTADDVTALAIVKQGNSSDLRWLSTARAEAHVRGNVVHASGRRLALETVVPGFEGSSSASLTMVGRSSERSIDREISSIVPSGNDTSLHFAIDIRSLGKPETWDLSLVLRRNEFTVELPVLAASPTPQHPTGRFPRLVAQRVRRAGNAVVIELRATLATRLIRKLRSL